MKKNISFLNLFFLVLWCLLIFYLSSIPGLKSDFPSYVDLVLRKIFHIFEFFVLMILFYKNLIPSTSKNKSIFYAVIFTMIYSLTDEYHQSFVDNRNGNIFDVLIDSLGVFLAAFLLLKEKILNSNN